MEPAVLREDMVDGLESPPRDVLADEDVAVAMREVPRHAFVDDERTAYADREHEVLGTRVLAPSTVARLLQALALEGDETVLIVGAGVGYTAAVAAELVGETNVHAVDISRPLVVEARDNLADAGYDGVLVDCRDGANGLPEYAPFDRILLEAAAVDPPRALLDQRTDAGRLVFPRGPTNSDSRPSRPTATSIDSDPFRSLRYWSRANSRGPSSATERPARTANGRSDAPNPAAAGNRTGSSGRRRSTSRLDGRVRSSVPTVRWV